MTNNEQNRQALKAALKSTPRKVKIETPEPGTFCGVSFCADAASKFMDDRPVCGTHYKTFKAIEAEVGNVA